MDDSKASAVNIKTELKIKKNETTSEIGDSINKTPNADDLKVEKTATVSTPATTSTTPATTTTTPTTSSSASTEQIERRSSLLSAVTHNSVSALTTSPEEVNVIVAVAGSASVEVSKDNPATTSAEVESDTERNCWICFASDEDNRMAAWVQPCKCRGTTKWVHQSCLYRWIDEKQKGNALRSVSCQQCQTEYIIVFPNMGKLSNILESFDNLIKRLSPFLAAGIFVGSLYWTAVTYGAVTFLQIVGHKKGLALMENGDPLILLLGLPAIPVGLVLGRMIRWEDAVIRLIRNRRSVARKFPLMNLLIPYPEEEDEQTSQNPSTPTLSDPVSATRVFCGALLLPTISSIVGRLLFESIGNTLHRTLLGGLTFITVKGILKIYLKQQQYTRKKKRRIIDYTEENVRAYMNRNTNGPRQFGAVPAGPRAQVQQQPQRAYNGDFMV